MKLGLVLLLAPGLFAQSQEVCRITPLTQWRPNADPEPARVPASASAADALFVSPRIAAPDGGLYFRDGYARLRRLWPDGRLTTIAGNGRTGPIVDGPAMDSPVPHDLVLKISPSGDLHVASGGRVRRLRDGRFDTVAGTGRAGFNGKRGSARNINLGEIAALTFDRQGRIFIADGFARIRRVDPAGELETVAGSARRVSSGLPGPATEALLGRVRSLLVGPDGTIWIRSEFHYSIDPSGYMSSHTGARFPFLEGPDGELYYLDSVFQGSSPRLSLLVRVSDGTVAFEGYRGIALGVTNAGGLVVEDLHPDSSSLLLLFQGGTHRQIAQYRSRLAPAVDLSPAVWRPDTGGLIAATKGVAIEELRPGLAPRMLLRASDLEGVTTGGFGALAMGPGGRVLFPKSRTGPLMQMDASGQARELIGSGRAVPYLAPTSGRESMAWSTTGELFWIQGATPGTTTERIGMWQERTLTWLTYTAPGAEFLVNLPDGTVAAWFRDQGLRRVSISDPGPVIASLSPLAAAALHVQGSAAFWVSPGRRLFRQQDGLLEMFPLTELYQEGGLFPPRDVDMLQVIPLGRDAIVQVQADTYSGYLRIEDFDGCQRRRAPRVPEGGVVSAAGYGYPDAITSLGLLAIFGENLAGPEAEAPALDRYGSVGPGSPDGPRVSFRGGIVVTTFPLLFASPNQLVVQAPYTHLSFVGNRAPALLSLRWEGIEVPIPGSFRDQQATPALFVTGGRRDGFVAALNQDGTVHGAANPVRVGSVVQLFAAGLGNTSPQPVTGDSYSSSELSPLLTFPFVTIGGLGADLIFGGGAPGLLGGVYQVNVRVPESLDAGDHEVVIRMTGVATDRNQKALLRVVR